MINHNWFDKKSAASTSVTPTGRRGSTIIWSPEIPTGEKIKKEKKVKKIPKKGNTTIWSPETPTGEKKEKKVKKDKKGEHHYLVTRNTNRWKNKERAKKGKKDQKRGAPLFGHQKNQQVKKKTKKEKRVKKDKKRGAPLSDHQEHQQVKKIKKREKRPKTGFCQILRREGVPEVYSRKIPQIWHWKGFWQKNRSATCISDAIFWNKYWYIIIYNDCFRSKRKERLWYLSKSLHKQSKKTQQKRIYRENRKFTTKLREYTKHVMI